MLKNEEEESQEKSKTLALMQLVSFQTAAQMPVVPKIKRLRSGSQSLVNDHRDNGLKFTGGQHLRYSRPWEATLLDCSPSVIFVVLLSSLIFT